LLSSTEVQFWYVMGQCFCSSEILADARAPKDSSIVIILLLVLGVLNGKLDLQYKGYKIIKGNEKELEMYFFFRITYYKLKVRKLSTIESKNTYIRSEPNVIIPVDHV